MHFKNAFGKTINLVGYYTVIMLTHTWLSDSELRRDSRDEHLLEVGLLTLVGLKNENKSK